MTIRPVAPRCRLQEVSALSFVVAAVAAALAAAPLAAETPKASPVPALAKPASKLAPIAAPVVKIEQLTKETFKKLPDTALLEVGGKQIRKGNFIADFNRQASARQLADAKVSKSGLDAIRARLSLAEDKAVAESEAQVRKHLDQGGKK